MTETCKGCSFMIQQSPRQTVGHCSLHGKTTSPNTKACLQKCGPKLRLDVAIKMFMNWYNFNLVSPLTLKREFGELVKAYDHYMESNNG